MQVWKEEFPKSIMFFDDAEGEDAKEKDSRKLDRTLKFCNGRKAKHGINLRSNGWVIACRDSVT